MLSLGLFATQLQGLHGLKKYEPVKPLKAGGFHIKWYLVCHARWIRYCPMGQQRLKAVD